jgi:hypothetical protein
MATELEICVDGWSVFKVTKETNEQLEAVGLMTLLPSGSLPIAMNISANAGNLSWSAQVGEVDEEWQALPESKRWKKVYLFATGSDVEPQWSWGRQYRGAVNG